MKTYYSCPEGDIYHGDCLEVMRQFPDNSFDLVLTDPPYGIGLEYDIYDDTLEKWKIMFENTLPDMQRVAHMVIMPSCQIKLLPYIYATNPPDWLMCWYKGSPGHCAHVGFNDWEPMLVYGKIKGLQMHDYVFASPTAFDNGHPCPKPILWAHRIIRMATKRGMKMLDPFFGSGTTGVACVRMGRKFVGIEISGEYCEIAKKRIIEEKAKYGLFNNLD